MPPSISRVNARLRILLNRPLFRGKRKAKTEPSRTYFFFFFSFSGLKRQYLLLHHGCRSAVQHGLDQRFSQDYSHDDSRGCGHLTTSLGKINFQGHSRSYRRGSVPHRLLDREPQFLRGFPVSFLVDLALGQLTVRPVASQEQANQRALEFEKDGSHGSNIPSRLLYSTSYKQAHRQRHGITETGTPSSRDYGEHSRSCLLQGFYFLYSRIIIFIKVQLTYNILLVAGVQQ